MRALCYSHIEYDESSSVSLFFLFTLLYQNFYSFRWVHLFLELYPRNTGAIYEFSHKIHQKITIQILFIIQNFYYCKGLPYVYEKKVKNSFDFKTLFHINLPVAASHWLTQSATNLNIPYTRRRSFLSLETIL